MSFNPRVRREVARWRYTWAHCSVTVALALSVRAPAIGAQLPPVEIQELRAKITTGLVDGAQHGDLHRYRNALLRIYSDSDASLRWIIDGKPTPQASALLAEVRQADLRGLIASDYDAESLTIAFRGLGTDARNVAPNAAMLRVDAWLTLSAMRFIDNARRGRVDPRSLGFALPREQADPNFASLISTLSGRFDIRSMIDSLEPPYTEFRSLETLLRRYRALSVDSGLARLPSAAAAIHLNERWQGSGALRRLLEALGDIPQVASAPAPGDSEAYDDDLVEGVKRFQRRHGLSVDGVVGKATLAQLRTPIASRIAQIELTMERWRWLPSPVERRLIVVNIPEFRLYALEEHADGVRAGERMDIIVGSAYNGRRTPVFVGTLRYVVFHPYWDVPRSIARREEIPKIRSDSGYADREGMEIVHGGDIGARRYPVTEENLQRVIAGTLRLRQRPGPRNALGNVKFVFPNAYNVYVHGTPQQYLFALARRDFSHGCIRASDPEALASFVLQGQAGWDGQRIAMSMADSGETRTVTLDQPIPIFIIYASVVVGDDGTPSFFADVYGHDASLARVLRRRAVEGIPIVSAKTKVVAQTPSSKLISSCQAFGNSE